MPKKKPERSWMTVDEAAARLEVCTMTVYRYLAEGKITSVRLNAIGKHRINKESVEALLNPPLEPKQ